MGRVLRLTILVVLDEGFHVGAFVSGDSAVLSSLVCSRSFRSPHHSIWLNSSCHSVEVSVSIRYDVISMVFLRDHLCMFSISICIVSRLCRSSIVYVVPLSFGVSMTLPQCTGMDGLSSGVRAILAGYATMLPIG